MSENFQVPSRAASVVPSDTTELVASAIYVGGSGNLAVVTEGNDTVTLSNIVAGTTIVLRIRRVNSTNTTATNIVRMW